jgi:3-hydroxybutyryl-CoA dehydrogenase
MRLVEVVATPDTAPATLERLQRTMQAWGKTALHCADSPGFIVNRVNRPFTLEALAILEEGIADVPAIDATLRDVGYPMGPFELMDLIGIDVNLAVATAIHEAFVARSDPLAERFRPTETQQRMVADRRLGRKTSSGFYQYPREAQAQRPQADPPRVRDRIVRRVELSIIAEAYRAVEERIATREDIDAAMRLGAAHPHGPFENVARLGGPAVVLAALREHDSMGPRFAIPAAAIKEAADMVGR